MLKVGGPSLHAVDANAVGPAPANFLGIGVHKDDTLAGREQRVSHRAANAAGGGKVFCVIFKYWLPGTEPPSCLMRLPSCCAWPSSSWISVASACLMNSARTPSRSRLLAR